jgi:hypothetical protein
MAAAPSIIVATPAFGDVFYTPCVQSLLRLERAIDQRKWTMRHSVVSYAHINEARNYLLTYWYDKTDATHLLFVDADMGFEPQLIFDMVALDKPVAGVIYTKRQMDLKRLAEAARREAPEHAIAQAHEFIIRPVRGRPPRKAGNFIEVEGCGTGIMLIQRAAIATMLKMLPEVSVPRTTMASPLSAGLDRMIRAFDNIVVDRRLLVNDFAFCHRWRVLCKGEIWARVDQSVPHIGLHKFTARYSDAGGGPRITMPTISLDRANKGSPSRQ